MTMARLRAAKMKKLHDNPDFFRQSWASEEELFSSEDAAILYVLRNSRCIEVLLENRNVTGVLLSLLSSINVEGNEVDFPV